MKAVLVDKKTGQYITLSGRRYLLGRHPKNDIQNTNPCISNYHCLLYRHGFSFYLSDLKSTNGTFVNGQRVLKPVRLKDADQISLAGDAAEYLIRIDSYLTLPLLHLRAHPLSLIIIGLFSLLLFSSLLAFHYLSHPVSITVREALALIEKEFGKQIFPTDSDFVNAVNEWCTRLKADKDFALVKSKRRGLQPLLEQILAEERLPLQFSVLVWVESQYEPEAQNPLSRATGLWQLMPDTARAYGLTVNKGLDERKEPVKCTRAAARYLNDLMAIFGDEDFLLILAAYNTGEANLMAILKQLKDPLQERNFWYLSSHNLIPDETKAYVLKAVAVLVLEKQGFLT